MKLTKVSITLLVPFLLVATSALSELKRVELSVFGMD
jgi:hypothetical protein